MQLYTKDEVAKHNKAADNWIIIYGKVYDVSKIREDHPGGPEILDKHAGMDATHAFEEVFHSDYSRTQMKELQIGVLEGYKEGYVAPSRKQNRNWKKIGLVGVSGVSLVGLASAAGYHKLKKKT